MRSEEKSQGFVLFILLVLTVFFLVTPFVARSLQGNVGLISQESYFHSGLAKDIIDREVSDDVTPTFFDLMNSFFLRFFSLTFIGKVLPVLFGLASCVLFYFQSKTLLSVDEQAAASILLIISPLFIILFSSLAPAGFMLFIFLLAWWLFDKSAIGAMGVLSVLIVVDAYSFIIGSVLLLSYGLLKKEWKTVAVGGSIGIFIIIFVESFFGFFARNSIVSSVSVADFFVSLGSNFGFSFFIIFLALIGFIVSWSKERYHVMASLLCLIVFIISFSNTAARVLVLPLTALLAAKGIVRLIKRPWALKSMKSATLFLIALSLLFTLVLTIANQVDQTPTQEMNSAMEYLRTVADEKVVLSSAANGVFISELGGQIAFIDEVVRADTANREVANRIFMAQRLSVALDLLGENTISYILVDEKMRDGGVWTFDEQGLLFLLEHSSRFVLLYDKKGIQIYRVVSK